MVIDATAPTPSDPSGEYGKLVHDDALHAILEDSQAGDRYTVKRVRKDGSYDIWKWVEE